MGWFRRKPIVVEAMRWMGDNRSALQQFAAERNHLGMVQFTNDNMIVTQTNGPVAECPVGWWLLCTGWKRELSVMADEEFTHVYEPSFDPSFQKSK